MPSKIFANFYPSTQVEALTTDEQKANYPAFLEVKKVSQVPELLFLTSSHVFLSLPGTSPSRCGRAEPVVPGEHNGVLPE